MRTFIAIPLTEQTHQELARLQDNLYKSGADVKWVVSSNIHLTLKFLGEVDDEQVEKVKASLAGIVKQHRPFNIRLAKIGAFPKISSPRVVWVGIDEGYEECKALAKSIEDAMGKLGFEKEERAFSPHLTLGRVRSSKNKAQLIACIEKEKDFAFHDKVSVDKVMLFASTLTPKGSIYTPLKDFPLV